MATEKRLIDANALAEKVMGIAMYIFGVRNGKTLIKEFLEKYRDSVMREIASAPVVEAVEVVRCKDCKHWHEETGWCNQHSHFIGSKGEACHPWESIDWKSMDADDFCSYGERRTEC